MTTLREAATQALEALDFVSWDGSGSCWLVDPYLIESAITALKAALAEPTWCEIHQHHKWCEHNGGVMGTTGWEAP